MQCCNREIPDGAAGDKMALIGHANEAQLRDYEDINLADLRKITDAL